MRIAGIGSRATPDNALTAITAISHDMARDGLLLRSGGAAGADATFERGFRLAKDAMTISELCPEPEIYIPWYGFNKLKGRNYINCQTLPRYGQACEIASQFHPNWAACTRGPRALHARNVFIMLGRDLDTPVDRVYCWTPNAKVTGGTGQALRLAIHLEIPIINLARQDSWCEDQYLNDYMNESRANFRLSS